MPILDGEIKPLMMTSSIGVNSHSQIVFRVSDLYCRIKVPTFKVGIEDKRRFLE